MSADYVGVLAPGDNALRDRVDEILRQAMRDGRLEAIFRRWDMWNEDQPRLYARVLASSATEMVPASAGAAGLDRLGGNAPLLSFTAPRSCDHARCFVCWPWRWPSSWAH